MHLLMCVHWQWLADRQTERLDQTKTRIQKNRETNRQAKNNIGLILCIYSSVFTDRQIDRQTDERTGGLTKAQVILVTKYHIYLSMYTDSDRQTDCVQNRLTHTHTHTHTYTPDGHYVTMRSRFPSHHSVRSAIKPYRPVPGVPDPP